jgi:RNA polymerase sigma-70 factor, ECF subfamily
MPPEDLEHALAGATRGDQAAVAVLYRALNPSLLRFLRHHAGSSAEDLASEVWLGLAPQLAGFDGAIRELRALMFSSAHRRVVDQYRRNGCSPDAVPFDDAFDRPDGAGTGTETTAVANLSAQEAVAALARSLPEDQCEIVLLRVLGDLDVDQVAEIVGKTNGAVRIAQHRALQRLQRTWQRKAVTR